MVKVFDAHPSHDSCRWLAVSSARPSVQTQTHADTHMQAQNSYRMPARVVASEALRGLLYGGEDKKLIKRAPNASFR